MNLAQTKEAVGADWAVIMCGVSVTSVSRSVGWKALPSKDPLVSLVIVICSGMSEVVDIVARVLEVAGRKSWIGKTQLEHMREI